MTTPAFPELFSAVVALSWRAGWLILVLTALRRLVRGRVPAQVWFVAWILVALRLLLPFSLPVSWSPYKLFAAKPPVATPASPAGVVTTAPAESEPAALTPAASVPPAPAPILPTAATVPASGKLAPRVWSPMEILAAVWSAGVGLFIAVRLAGLVGFQRRLRDAQPVSDPRAAAIVEDELRRTRVSLRLWETHAIAAPALYGLVRPRLLLPPGLAAKLTDDELRHVVRHELAHWRRRDLWAQAILQAAVAVHWFNPLVWLAARFARADCELACDEFVLRRESSAGASAYGATLLKVLGVVRARRQPAAVVAMLESKEQLEQRIRMIAGYRAATLGRVCAGVALVAVLAAVSFTRESRAEEAKKASMPSATATTLPASQDTAAPAAATASRRLAIAILPLTDLSADKENEIFADGLTEEIISGLGHNLKLWVATRASMFRFKNSTKPLAEIARNLSVDYLGSGSVRRAGPRIRLTFELRRASDEQLLWTETFDRELRDTFSVQEELASTIVTSVLAAMAPAKPSGTLTLSAGQLTITPANAPAANPADKAQRTGDIDRQERLEQGKRAFDTLKAPTEEQRQKVDRLHQQLQAYKEKNGLVSLDSRRDIINESLKALNLEAARTKQALNVAEQRLDQVRVCRASKTDLTTLPFIASQSLVATLMARTADLKVQRTTLSERYREQHPKMVQLIKTLAGTETQLSSAIDAACAQLESECQAIRSHHEQVLADLEKQKQEGLAVDRLAVEYTRLERELRANEQVLNTVAARSLDTVLSANSPAQLTRGEKLDDFTVSVMGAVNQQGGVRFSAADQPILLDAIARSGGFGPNADRNAVRVIRLNSDNSRSTYTIKEPALMAGRDEVGVLQRGDIVVVPDKAEPAAAAHVTVGGQILNPGIVTIPPGGKLTLVDAITISGGPTPTGKLRTVKLSRRQADGTLKVLVIDVEQLMRGEGTETYPLESGDIVYVPERML